MLELSRILVNGIQLVVQRWRFFQGLLFLRLLSEGLRRRSVLVGRWQSCSSLVGTSAEWCRSWEHVARLVETQSSDMLIPCLPLRCRACGVQVLLHVMVADRAGGGVLGDHHEDVEKK